jgi:ParB/RepB/Spo0J family partition protein
MDGERFALVAGEHRLAAAGELGWSTIAAQIGEQAQGRSGDQGAENILRKQLTPLEEARQVEKMLGDGYTVDGAATVLGWSKRRVTARRRILELPEAAQTLVGSGEIPAAGIDTLLEIQTVSPKLAALVAEVLAESSAEGSQLSAQLARDPGWLVRQVLSHRPGVLFAELAGGTLYEDQVGELKLGKKTTALYAEAKTLHGQRDRYAYGPPPVRLGEAELDHARAAGVLLELDRTQVILDRGVYRELDKTALARTVEDLRARAATRATEQRERKAAGVGKRECTPREEADVEHRAQTREFTRRAHNVNLDLGTALIDGLAAVDPADMDVARFFAYGLLGPDTPNYLGTGDHVARTIAANGIRLVLDEHRTTETPTLKRGHPGKSKVTYGEPEPLRRASRAPCRPCCSRRSSSSWGTSVHARCWPRSRPGRVATVTRVRRPPSSAGRNHNPASVSLQDDAGTLAFVWQRRRGVRPPGRAFRAGAHIAAMSSRTMPNSPSRPRRIGSTFAGWCCLALDAVVKGVELAATPWQRRGRVRLTCAR